MYIGSSAEVVTLGKRALDTGCFGAVSNDRNDRRVADPRERINGRCSLEATCGVRLTRKAVAGWVRRANVKRLRLL